MKCIFFIALLAICVCFSSCASKIVKDKNLVENKILLDTVLSKEAKFSCPEDGNCYVTFSPNKSINIVYINNHLSYKIIDDASKTLIQFQYIINQNDAPIDGGYRETVFFEVNKSDKTINLNNFDLQKTKMIYGRYCNCRGQSGVFLVENGNLKLSKTIDKISFTLNYSTGEIPQLINKIIVKDNLLVN